LLNRAVKHGKPVRVRGTATVVDFRTHAVFKVRFNEWFSVLVLRVGQSNYFIIWLAPD